MLKRYLQQIGIEHDVEIIYSTTPYIYLMKNEVGKNQ